MGHDSDINPQEVAAPGYKKTAGQSCRKAIYRDDCNKALVNF